MKCIKCGETRLSEFYSSRLKKYDYRCKRCCNQAQAQWKRDNPDRTWAKRHPEKARAYMRHWMREHPEVNRRNAKRWYEKHSAKHLQWRLAYVKENPQRHRAQTYAYRKLRIRQICEIKECLNLGERHHDDYSKPLEIRWLCKKHHKELHRQTAVPALV